MKQFVKNNISKCPFMMTKIMSQVTPQNQLSQYEQCPLGKIKDAYKKCVGCESKCPYMRNMFNQSQTIDNFDQKYDLDDQDDFQETRQNYQVQFDLAINKLKQENRYRLFANIKRKVGEFPLGTYIDENGEQKNILVWCSNDYLGMGQNPEVLKELTETALSMGSGSGGTRNIGGNSQLHQQLEEELADLHQKQQGLITSSCFVANQSAINALANVLKDVVFLSDEKNHASLIEGIRNSRADKIIFKHNDLKDLESQLQKQDINRNKVIIFESVYSMSGSIAPIEQICQLANKYNALTFIDEVHAVGLYGNKGGGITEVLNIQDKVDFISGTLSKGYGCFGGYIVANKQAIDCIRSYAPNYIFTTSLPPPIVAASLASVKYLKKSQSERLRLHDRANMIKKKLKSNDIPLIDNNSHIIPVFIGDPIKVKQASNLLLKKFGIYIQPINYPTVPRNQEILRISPTPNHTDFMVNQLIDAVVKTFEILEIKKHSQLKEFQSQLNQKSYNQSQLEPFTSL